MQRALATLALLLLAALLAAPTVAEVEEVIDDLDIRRDLRLDLWKWSTPPPPPGPPSCGDREVPVESEVTDWPRSIFKQAPYELGGHVIIPDENGRGLADVRVEVFLNETKDEPGILLGERRTGADGRFTLGGHFPTELRAERYHIVLHAHRKQTDCRSYDEHWSDPEMDILAHTNIELDLPRYVAIGETATIAGRLVDIVNASVANERILLTVEGRGYRAETDAEGRFEIEHEARRAGAAPVIARFLGTRYYGGSQVESAFTVEPSSIVVNDSLVIVRGEPTLLTGHVTDEGRKARAVVARLDNVSLGTCATCPPQSGFAIPLERDGTFAQPLHAPPDTPLVEFTASLNLEGTRANATSRGRIVAPVELGVEGEGGVLARRFSLHIEARDENHEPAPGRIVLSGPLGASSGTLDANGTLTLSGAATCGSHDFRLAYEGPPTHQASEAAGEVAVCPWFAWVPEWVWSTPWWAWPAGAATLVAAYVLARALYRKRAPTLTAGPALALAIVRPDDEAREIVGVGEDLVVEARLEAPLPDGHALRFVAGGGPESATLGADLAARHTIAAERPGELRIRAEIVDARGHPRSRRTLHARAVRYGEEIERRHVGLGRAHMGERAFSATARELQRRLAQRVPLLRGTTLGVIAATFEEADYSPRDASREDLLAFLRAEAELSRHVKEAEDER